MANKTYQVVFELGGKIKGSLGNAFGSASKQMARLQKDLKDISGTQRAMTSQKSLESTILKTSAAVKIAEGKLGVLASKMMTTANPTKKLSKEFTDASLSLDRLNQKLSRERNELNQIRNSLSAAGVNAGNFTRKEKELAAAAEKAQAALGKQRQRQASIQADEAKMNKYNQRFSTAVGVAMATVLPSVDYVQRQKELRINANVNQLSQAEIDKTNRQLLTIGAQYGQGRDDVMAAWGQLSQAGLGNNAYTVDLTKMASRAAYASGASSEEVSNAMKALYNNMGIKDPRQMYRALGILISQANAPGGQFEFRNMVADLPQLLAQMGALGVKGHEGTATLGAMLQTLSPAIGKDPDTVNRLWNVLMKATVPETVKNFKEFTDKQGNYAGINLPAFLDNARKNHKNVAMEYLKKVFEMTNGGDPELVAKLFQDMQALQGLSTLATDEGQRKMEKFRAIGLKDNNRTIEQNVRLNDSNPGMQASKGWQGIVKAGQLVAEAFGPTITGLLNAAGYAAEKFTSWFDPQRHPMMFAGLKLATGLFGSFLALFVGSSAIGKIFTALKLFSKESWGMQLFSWLWKLKDVSKIAIVVSRSFGIIRGAIMGVIPVIQALSAAVLTNPIAWIVIAALAAIVAAGVYFWRHWDTWGPRFKKLGGVIVSSLKWICDMLKWMFWDSLFGPLWKNIKDLYNGFVSLLRWIDKNVPSIRRAGSAIYDWYWNPDKDTTSTFQPNGLRPAGARGNTYQITYSPNIDVSGSSDPAAVHSNASAATKAAADDFFKRFQDHTNREQRLSYGF